jgi:hypothetical protein
MVGRFIRRHRIAVPVALVSVALVGLGGILQAEGAFHSHGVQMVYKTGSKSIGPGGVNFVTQFCPSGTRITGTGSSTPGIAYVNEQKIDPGTNSGTVFYINNSSQGSTIRAQIACVKNRTTSANGKLSAASRDERQAVLQAAQDRKQRLQAQLDGQH